MMVTSGLMTCTYLTRWVLFGPSRKWAAKSLQQELVTQWVELDASCTCLVGMTATSASTISTSWTWTPWLGFSRKFLEWYQWHEMLTQWLSLATSSTYSVAIPAISILKTCMCSTRRRWLGQSLRSLAVLRRACEVTLPTWLEIRFICSEATTVEARVSRKLFPATICMCSIRTLCAGATLLKMRKLPQVDRDTQRASSEWSSCLFSEDSMGASG